jgi:hypothetical protein
MDKKVLSLGTLFLSKEWSVTYNTQGNYIEVTNLKTQISSHLTIKDGQYHMPGLMDSHGTYLSDPAELERHRVLAEQYTNHLKK